MSTYDGLNRYLLEQSRKCLRPPVDRFRHRWMAPMPLSANGEAYLRFRQGGRASEDKALARPDSGDGFQLGDYSLGLFHHDASESAIELLQHAEFREAAAGSLLCMLDCALPSGMVPRSILSNKYRDPEPAKPVLAQYALRIVQALGDGGLAWAEQHRVLERVAHAIRYYEDHYTGAHGLLLTHSALASGFDSDLLTAQLPDKVVEGPDTNAFMVLEYEAMETLHRSFGQARLANEYEAKAETLRERMELLLWHEDDRGGLYGGLRFERGTASLEPERMTHRNSDGKRVPFETWTSLLPLYAGIPSQKRADQLVKRLTSPDLYWSPYGVRTVAATDPFFHQAARVLLYDPKKQGRGPVSNWTGPIWILSNYYMAEGLARYGFAEQAKELATKTALLLERGLAQSGALHECYDDSGKGLWPRQSTFISWNVLALTLLRSHVPELASSWSKD